MGQKQQSLKKQGSGPSTKYLSVVPVDYEVTFHVNELNDNQSRFPKLLRHFNLQSTSLDYFMFTEK